METLGVDAGTETDFDTGAEGLDVGYCGDTGVVDFSLTVRTIDSLQQKELRKTERRNVVLRRNTVEGGRDPRRTRIAYEGR